MSAVDYIETALIGGCCRFITTAIWQPAKESNTYRYNTHIRQCRRRLLTPFCYEIITFRMSRRRSVMYSGHARLCVCLSLAAFPHYCTDPDATLRNGRGCPLLCSVGRIWISARISLLWQHSANAKCQRLLCILALFLVSHSTACEIIYCLKHVWQPRNVSNIGLIFRDAERDGKGRENFPGVSNLIKM